MFKIENNEKLELDFNVDFGGFDLDFDLGDFDLIESDNLNTRILKPKISKRIFETVKYRNALDLAKEVSLESGSRTFAIVNGSFIFGDLIEALVDTRKINPKKIYISTLSLSENNIDSFKNIYDMSYLEELNIFLSGYFYSHEKHNLVPYLYETLDIDNKLQVSFCDTHCKICLIETHDNKHYVIHGSANLRSSSNIEQFEIEESEELYNFNKEYMDSTQKFYKTINKDEEKIKAARGEKLWQVVVGNGQK